MSWRIDPLIRRSGREVDAGRPRRVAFVLVGVGGTGGYLAEHIARLALHHRLDARLTLVDFDRVEEHNVFRQPFAPADVGAYKAQVLFERLGAYPIELGYRVTPYDAEGMFEGLFGGGDEWDACFLVGAVDNPLARHELAETLRVATQHDWSRRAPSRIWYLDCGNAAEDGQLLLGNALTADQLREAFARDDSDWRCTALPAPTVQAPELLSAPAKTLPGPVPEGMDCALAQALGEQGPAINTVMAALAKATLSSLLEGRCAWRRVILNLADGQLRYTPADPADCARLVGLPTNALLRQTGRRRRAA